MLELSIEHDRTYLEKQTKLFEMKKKNQESVKCFTLMKTTKFSTFSWPQKINRFLFNTQFLS